MDTLFFIVVIFFAFFTAFGIVISTIRIRNAREEVKNLQLEVNKLKDENEKLRCSEQSLLWQRQNLRNEIRKLVLDSHYWGNLKEWMFQEVTAYMRSEAFRSMEGANRVERLYQQTFKKHYKW